MSERSPRETDWNSLRPSAGAGVTISLLVLVVLSTAVVAARPGAATRAPIQIEDCTTISSPGTYVLARDVRTNGTGDCIRVAAPGVVLDGAEHTIVGPWEEGDSSYSAGVNVTTRNVTVEHLTVTNFARGITASSDADAVTVSNVTVEHAWFGILLGWSSGLDDGIVTDSRIDEVRVGVQISSFGANNTVSNNAFGRAWQKDVRLLAGATDNVIRQNDASDVELDQAVGNRLVNNSLGDVELVGADDNVITGNDVDPPGIELRKGADRNAIRNNVVGGAFDAIDVTDSSGNRIVSNTVLTTSDWGIILDDAPNTTVRSNRVRGHRIGISVHGTGPVRIRDNTVRNSSDSGIRINAIDVSIVGNEVRNVSEPGGADTAVDLSGIHVKDSETVVVRDNDVSATRIGVLVRESTDVRVVGNGVTNASYLGIKGIDTTRSSVTDNVLRGNTGALTVAQSTALRLVNNTAVNGNYGTSVYDSHDITIGESTFEDNAYVGLRIRNVADVVVAGVTVSGHQRTGIRMGTLTNVSIRNVESSGNGNGIRGIRSENVTFVNTTATGNSGYGILVRDVEHTTFRGTTVRMNNYGLRLADAANTTVTNTMAADHDNAGVFVERSTDTRLVNTTSVSNDAGTGIRVDDANRTTIVGSDVADNRYGARFNRSRVTILENISATGNQYAGVRLFGTTNTTIRSSRATGNRFGLKMIAVAETTVTGTTASGNRWAGIRVSNDSWKGRGSGPVIDTRLVNVTVRDNGISGVRLVSTTGTVVRNISLVGNSPGVWLSGTDGTHLAGVSASRNQDFDVLVAGGSTFDRARNVSLGDGTVVGFSGTDFSIDTTERRPADPDGYENVSRYVDVGVTSSGGSLALAVSYTDQAVSDAGVNESTLRLWQERSGSDWTLLDDNDSVNTMTNTVSATVRTSGIVAPLGEETNETTTATNEMRPPTDSQVMA